MTHKAVVEKQLAGIKKKQIIMPIYSHSKDYLALRKLKREMWVHRTMEVIFVVFVYAVIVLTITNKLCVW